MPDLVFTIKTPAELKGAKDAQAALAETTKATERHTEKAHGLSKAINMLGHQFGEVGRLAHFAFSTVAEARRKESVKLIADMNAEMDANILRNRGLGGKSLSELQGYAQQQASASGVSLERWMESEVGQQIKRAAEATEKVAQNQKEISDAEKIIADFNREDERRKTGAGKATEDWKTKDADVQARQRAIAEAEAIQKVTRTESSAVAAAKYAGTQPGGAQMLQAAEIADAVNEGKTLDAGQKALLRQVFDLLGGTAQNNAQILEVIRLANDDVKNMKRALMIERSRNEANRESSPMIAAADFTAAQIATTLGKSPRVVRRALDGVGADGEFMVRGNLTKAWKVETLPAALQKELEDARLRRGLATVADLFKQPDTWQPKICGKEIPWNEVCSEQQAEAMKLQRAMLPILERHRSLILDNGELVEMGLRSYKQEFGREISAEKWRYLFNRTLERDWGTLERDRGAQQFHRPELFLTGNLRRTTPGPTRVDDSDFASISDCLALFGDPLKPTIQEVDALWIEAVELFRETDTDRPKKFKRRLLDFLWRRASFLAASPNALRVNFDRKVKIAAQSANASQALLDGRHLKRGESRAPAIPQEDVDRLAWSSVHDCGTRTTQAIREAGKPGERSSLSAATLELINAPHKSKSHVNRRLFSIVHRDAQLIAPYLLGKKAIDDATASLRRDWLLAHSMDQLTADDFTMPAYWFIPDGKGWWTLTRGQCLILIDARSRKVLGWSLQPDRNYNSLVIRTLMNRTCRQWGLPRTWYFENGIWRNAHVVKGPPREWSEGKSWAEYKPGWEKLGVRFVHAKRARSKPSIENVGGMLQNLMERVPGYCGRDERRDCPEVTRRNKLAVEARRVEPHGLFLSFDGWESELGKLIASYNADVQQGDILNGTSPDEAFAAHWPHDDPPTALDSTCWHLLAHYVSERKVNANGIEFKIGAEKYIYRDENSTALRLLKVLAWFDPECPELLGVTDLKGHNPVLVRRDRKTDPNASAKPLSEAHRVWTEELEKVAAHNAYPKARFTVLKAKFEPTFRKNLVSPAVFDTAATFTLGRHDNQERQQQEDRRRSTVAKRIRKAGLPSSFARNADASTIEGAEMVARAVSAEAEAESEPAQASVKKTYYLKPFKPGGKSK